MTLSVRFIYSFNIRVNHPPPPPSHHYSELKMPPRVCLLLVRGNCVTAALKIFKTKTNKYNIYFSLNIKVCQTWWGLTGNYKRGKNKIKAQTRPQILPRDSYSYKTKNDPYEIFLFFIFKFFFLHFSVFFLCKTKTAILSKIY